MSLPALPVTVLAGYLGAGKTTLLNHLLRQAGGRRLCVLVNDFGSLNIDAELIESREGSMLQLAGGCVCCSFGSDLMEALAALEALSPRPDHILIEASGVAQPRPVAQTVSLLPHLRIHALVTVADASTVRARAADRYVADLVLAQLSQADLVVLNQIDRVAPPDLPGLEHWITQTAPQARIWPARRGELPPELLLDFVPSPRVREDGMPAFAGGSGRTTGFESRAWNLPQACDPRALAEILTRAGFGVARAKGILHDLCGDPVVLQVVGSRWALEPAPRRAANGPGRLVALGTRAQFRGAELEALLASVTILETPEASAPNPLSRGVHHART